MTARITSDSPVLIHLRPSVRHDDGLLVQVSHLSDTESFLMQRQFFSEKSKLM